MGVYNSQNPEHIIMHSISYAVRKNFEIHPMITAFPQTRNEGISRDSSDAGTNLVS